MIINGYPEFFESFDNPTLQLAADELRELTLRRFHARGEWQAKFVIEKELPSFEIRTAGTVLTVAGPDAVEILYGVYELAERFLGYLFFEPGRDILRGCGDVEVGDGVIVPARKVPFSVRGFIQEFPFNDQTVDLAKWMAKNKLNFLNVWMKYYDDLDFRTKEEFRIRGIEIQSGHHNFDYWIPAEKYHREHPEFFAEIDGVRIKPEADENALLLGKQLCTTNKGLRREIVKNMTEYIDRNPELSSVALIPNDGFGWCQCEECSKFYDTAKKGDLYSLSSHVYIADRIYGDMLQDVSSMLSEKRPDLDLYFCAYVNYCRPAPGFRLTKNMAVMMAPYWRCINHRIDEECPINSRYASDIKEWCDCKEGGKVIIYEYFMGVNFYLSLPMIFQREIFRECAYYASIGVDGIATQFHIPHWSVYGVNFLAMAHALRGDDADDVLPRLYEGLFGEDAAAGKDFYLKMQSIPKSAGPCHVPYPHSLFRRTALDLYSSIVQEARALAAKDPLNTFRKELVLWCEYLYRFKSLYDAYHSGSGVTVADIDALLTWIHSHRDSRVFVHERFDIYFDAWKSAVRSGKPWLHFNLDWEDEYIRIHEKFLNGEDIC